jgi:hypothetical protein
LPYHLQCQRATQKARAAKAMDKETTMVMEMTMTNDKTEAVCPIICNVKEQHERQELQKQWTKKQPW